MDVAFGPCLLVCACSSSLLLYVSVVLQNFMVMIRSFAKKIYFPYNLGSVFGYFAPLSHFVSTFYHIVILFHFLLTIGISWPLFCISVVIFAYLL